MIACFPYTRNTSPTTDCPASRDHVKYQTYIFSYRIFIGETDDDDQITETYLTRKDSDSDPASGITISDSSQRSSDKSTTHQTPATAALVTTVSTGSDMNNANGANSGGAIGINGSAGAGTVAAVGGNGETPAEQQQSIITELSGETFEPIINLDGSINNFNYVLSIQ